MNLREKIARAICGNWVQGDDRQWRVWLEEADDVLEVLRQQEPVAWMCSSEALLRMGYQKFSTTCSGDWNIPVYAGHQGAQAAVPKAQDTADLVSKALRQAYQLGQTYWQQADSEWTSNRKRTKTTQEKFHTLVDETRAALLASENP